MALNKSKKFAKSKKPSPAPVPEPVEELDEQLDEEFEEFEEYLEPAKLESLRACIMCKMPAESFFTSLYI